uniref:Uncharacterized protein n=1 Tax=Anguilla anguilla TaxID=7936 RepID=A0A0E9VX55_ANGAN
MYPYFSPIAMPQTQQHPDVK